MTIICIEKAEHVWQQSDAYYAQVTVLHWRIHIATKSWKAGLNEKFSWNILGKVHKIV